MGSSDLESPPTSYASLPSDDQPGSDPPRSSRRLLSIAMAATLLLFGLAALLAISTTESGLGPDPNPVPAPDPKMMDRWLAAGVSSKSSGVGPLKLGSGGPYQWTNQMLSWQRTGFHFQPERNWMNDPNGPMYYKGWYHFFYQYNPDAAVWGNIAWGHAVSRDLVRWKHLPIALAPDQWYDIKGVWSGSATLLPDGRVILLYTGGTNESAQVQNLAVPVDLNDPLLRNWAKAEANPVMVPPPGIGVQDFRDPTTAWYEPSDATWRVAIGSKDSAHSGMAMVYSTKDFVSYTMLPGILHSVKRVGMWECIDLYPIATSAAGANRGLDPSARPSNLVKHVLKASTSDDNSDYYAIGTYDPAANKWIPDDESLDVGIGLRYDWGKFYASKTFFDEQKQRRVLWGWISETDSESADIAKGWASLQGIPRTVLFDMKTRSNLLTWPVEEVESLRFGLRDFSGITIGAGSTLPLDVGGAAQLDIEAEFLINKEALEATAEADVAYECGTSGGAAARGLLGPFGLLVLANHGLTEQTATYFYVSRGTDGNLRTHFCQDELRSSKASDTVKKVIGHTVPVLAGETLSLRILVDHSIVESFAQGGRASATSRVYPTEAIYNSARVFLFNNATGATVTARTLKIWHMNSTSSQTFDI
uniref:Vacuolar invertase n=2 Tax=Agave TaxID=39509 RepID=I1ZBQ9_AGATE|nr:vacuolar invertase [Agave tequilana]AFJ21581.1 putative vacuolar invertase [Agave tequilana]